MARVYFYDRVYVADPHPTSRASMIRLRDWYRSQCAVRHRPKWREWLTFRKRYLVRQRKLAKGRLSCHYCGVGPLVINTRVCGKRMRATIDHVHPRSAGGREYDERNLVVACECCNQMKANKVIGE